MPSSSVRTRSLRSQVSLSLLLSWIVPLLTNPCSADEGRIALDPATVAQQIEKLESEIQGIAEFEAALEEQLLEARREAADSDRAYQSLRGEFQELVAKQRELEHKAKEQKSLLQKAQEKRKAAEAAAEQARKASKEAEQRLSELNKSVDEATHEAETLAKPLADLQTQLSTLLPTVEPIRLAMTKAEEESRVRRQRLKELQARFSGITEQRLEHQARIESMLRVTGQWVSFSEQIAPIFHARCVACHNARNAQGRYNMATFNSIRAMADSGIAIEPGDAENSLLVQLIEDGSMPYDADPLSSEQIALIKRWIDLGARIDASAEPEAPLIRLMPRITHPEPPAHYSTPIPVSAIAANPSGTRLASSGYHEVLLWSLPAGELTGRISNVAERVYGLDFHPDGRRLLVASGTPGQWGEVKVFDSHSGELLADLLVSEDAMLDGAFSPDGSRLAACGADGSIAILSIDGSGVPVRFIEDHSDWVNSIAWSPDGSLLVSTSRDKTAKVFDAGTGELKLTFSGHSQNVTAAGFLADGKRAFSIGDDRRILVWNTTDAKQLREVSGLSSEMHGLRLRGGQQILSAGSDGVVRLHQSSDGKLVRELGSVTDWISSLAVTADEQTVLFGDHAGQIHRVTVGDNAAAKHTWTAAPR